MFSSQSLFISFVNGFLSAMDGGPEVKWHREFTVYEPQPTRAYIYICNLEI